MFRRVGTWPSRQALESWVEKSRRGNMLLPCFFFQPMALAFSPGRKVLPQALRGTSDQDKTCHCLLIFLRPGARQFRPRNAMLYLSPSRVCHNQSLSRYPPGKATSLSERSFVTSRYFEACPPRLVLVFAGGRNSNVMSDFDEGSQRLRRSGTRPIRQAHSIRHADTTLGKYSVQLFGLVERRAVRSARTSSRPAHEANRSLSVLQA